jgi:hypothetical protein
VVELGELGGRGEFAEWERNWANKDGTVAEKRASRVRTWA